MNVLKMKKNNILVKLTKQNEKEDELILEIPSSSDTKFELKLTNKKKGM
jgi:hypothetical protein